MWLRFDYLCFGDNDSGDLDILEALLDTISFILDSLLYAFSFILDLLISLERLYYF